MKTIEPTEAGYLAEILEQFDVRFKAIESHGTGLINNTWKVVGVGKDYILQRVNQNVFKRPQDIDWNIRLMGDHIQKNHPEYFFVSPVATKSGETVYLKENYGWFRLFPFVDNSFTFAVVESPDLAYEAAFQFGKFTNVLSGLEATRLKITIPDFHNLTLRFRQFNEAIVNGDASRIKESNQLIKQLAGHAGIVEDFQKKTANAAFKIRVTHHDTKISNVLFNQHNKGICVIDLDTVMPGYFFSDVGDMMRTYLCPVSEEEKDFSKIHVRKEVFDAVIKGYRDAMAGELTGEELHSFLFAGKFMIYMQALRFLTDYLNNDVYYGSRYPGHNFVRAGNQLVLLEKLDELSAP